MERRHRGPPIVKKPYLSPEDRRAEFDNRRRAAQKFITSAAQLINNYRVGTEKSRYAREVVTMTPEVEVPTKAGLIRIVLEEQRIRDYWTGDTEVKFSLLASFSTTWKRETLLVATDSQTRAVGWRERGFATDHRGSPASLQKINNAIELIRQIKESLDSRVPPTTP